MPRKQLVAEQRKDASLIFLHPEEELDEVCVGYVDRDSVLLRKWRSPLLGKTIGPVELKF